MLVVHSFQRLDVSQSPGVFKRTRKDEIKISSVFLNDTNILTVTYILLVSIRSVPGCPGIFSNIDYHTLKRDFDF